MPCYDARPDYSGNITRKELDHLTKLLCEATQKLYNIDELHKYSAELVTWHSNHKTIDSLRGQLERKNNKD